MRCMDRHHKGDNRRGLVILKRFMQGEYEAIARVRQDGDGNFAEVGRGGGGAHTRRARAVVTGAPQSQPRMLS